MRNTDKAWEKWGEVAPYYGVLTSEEYRTDCLDADLKAKFFDTGRQHVDHVFTTIRKYVTSGFSPSRALDFGCGTGRVLIPIAESCEEAVGIDVSKSMLSECLTNCEAAGLKNVTLSKSDDLLPVLSGQYDLIHSFIVFQHIRRSRGEKMIPMLLKHLSDKGIAVLHFVYKWDANMFQRLAYLLRHHVPFMHPVMKLLRHQRICEPKMEMNVYDMNRLLSIFSDSGVQPIHAELVRHGTHNGVVFYLSKDGKAQPEN
jgi:SAM-dependent methyltransferase